MTIQIRPTFLVLLAAITLACFATSSLAYNPPKGPFATRYMDCCRAAFSYSRIAVPAGLYAPVDFCEKDGVTLIPFKDQYSGKNGCDTGGNQFNCNCIQPWVDTVDPELGYAFGAYNLKEPDGTIENTCWYVEFLPQDPNGKTMKVNKMIIQNINTSAGLPKGSWDLNLAGGGVGDYNKGCTNQWGSDWGKRFGGVDNEQACCKLPEGLRSSCLFRFRFFGSNPGLKSTPKRVRCPVGLIDRSGAQRRDDAQVEPYSGMTDRTGHPAPDRYQRNRSVCQNVDPLNIVSAVCGGSAGGGRLPKGYGMARQDAPGGSVPGGSDETTQPGGEPEGYGGGSDAGDSVDGGAGSLASPSDGVGSITSPNNGAGSITSPGGAAAGGASGDASADLTQPLTAHRRALCHSQKH